jgi:hypothetical protein
VLAWDGDHPRKANIDPRAFRNSPHEMRFSAAREVRNQSSDHRTVSGAAKSPRMRRNKVGKRLSRWAHAVAVEPEGDAPTTPYATLKSEEPNMAKKKRASSKRELIDTKRGGKRYVRRGGAGKFKESDQVSRALPSDRRKRAKKKAKRGQGDRGDR